MGCGSGGALPTYPAGGKVVFTGGKPLEGGWVELKSASKEQAAVARGQIQPDGSFQLSTFSRNDGAIEGEHLILIVPPRPQGDIEQGSVPIAIDPRFLQYKTSNLKCTITSDSSKNDLLLKVSRPAGRR